MARHAALMQCLEYCRHRKKNGGQTQLTGGQRQRRGRIHAIQSNRGGRRCRGQNVSLTQPSAAGPGRPSCSIIFATGCCSRGRVHCPPTARTQEKLEAVGRIGDSAKFLPATDAKLLTRAARSIVNRFCKDHFAASYKQTIGLDFFMKHIQLPGTCDPSAHCARLECLVTLTASGGCLSPRWNERGDASVGYRGTDDRRQDDQQLCLWLPCGAASI